MPNYNPEKIKKALESVELLIEKQKQVTEKIHELKRSLKRIEFALIPDFHFFLKRRQKEIEDFFSKDERFLAFNNNSRAGLVKKAKIRLILELKSVYGFSSQFESFKEIIATAEMIQQKDRLRLLKEGSIHT